LGAQQLAGLGIGHPLHEAYRMIVDRQPLPQRRKVESAGFDFQPLLLGFQYSNEQR
jgi:hypothetical protein